jgi:hypothetical protein
VIALKFLSTGRRGRFSGFRWPGAGVWVVPPAARSPCRRGVHACRVQDLPWWLDEELWDIELEGDVVVGRHKLLAPAGRLVSRVDAWTPGVAHQFGVACAWRARDHAVRALGQADRPAAAATLSACATLDEVLRTARRMLDDAPADRISLIMARDGAFRAISGAPPTSAYIAAHAARRIDGARGYTAERAWQSDWFRDHLGRAAEPTSPQAT